jgi:hypothetical protein
MICAMAMAAMRIEMRLMPPPYDPPAQQGCFVAERLWPSAPLAQPTDSVDVALALALTIVIVSVALVVADLRRPIV